MCADLGRVRGGELCPDICCCNNLIRSHAQTRGLTSVIIGLRNQEGDTVKRLAGMVLSAGLSLVAAATLAPARLAASSDRERLARLFGDAANVRDVPVPNTGRCRGVAHR